MLQEVESLDDSVKGFDCVGKAGRKAANAGDAAGGWGGAGGGRGRGEACDGYEREGRAEEAVERDGYESCEGALCDEEDGVFDDSAHHFVGYVCYSCSLVRLGC